MTETSTFAFDFIHFLEMDNFIRIFEFNLEK